MIHRGLLTSVLHIEEVFICCVKYRIQIIIGLVALAKPGCNDYSYSFQFLYGASMNIVCVQALLAEPFDLQQTDGQTDGRTTKCIISLASQSITICM